jgi:solute carrier family 45 protein 1/2/4
MNGKRRRLSTFDLFNLSISMAGAQIAWTVELGYTNLCLDLENPSNVSHARYGTPFLLSLGVSEHVTSLVWLAGPISGLIAQPVIGEYKASLDFDATFIQRWLYRCNL